MQEKNNSTRQHTNETAQLNGENSARQLEQNNSTGENSTRQQERNNLTQQEKITQLASSGCFYPSRIIGKLEEGRSLTSVAAEFGIAHSIVSRLWRQFQTTGTAIRGFSSSRPRGTTLADDRYIVLQARRNRRQTAGEIVRHTTQATGRPIYRVLPWPEDCTAVVCLHDALYGV
ncbi:transposable element Tcb1 transposase [Trichonephila clavipes]|nr:transposable element Tcb1 transposase [Trichonephila clavipes]